MIIINPNYDIIANTKSEAPIKWYGINLIWNSDDDANFENLNDAEILNAFRTYLDIEYIAASCVSQLKKERGDYALMRFNTKTQEWYLDEVVEEI